MEGNFKILKELGYTKVTFMKKNLDIFGPAGTKLLFIFPPPSTDDPGNRWKG